MLQRAKGLYQILRLVQTLCAEQYPFLTEKQKKTLQAQHVPPPVEDFCAGLDDSAFLSINMEAIEARATPKQPKNSSTAEASDDAPLVTPHQSGMKKKDKREADDFNSPSESTTNNKKAKTDAVVTASH